MITRRCEARNILYPNQKLMKLDCLPNHIFQNREQCKWGGAKGLEERPLKQARGKKKKNRKMPRRSVLLM